MKKTIIRSAVFVIVAVACVALVSMLYTKLADPLFDNIANGESLDVKKSDDSFNILLVGLDNSEKLADAIMLVNVNKTTQKISMLSIPRDTKIYSDGKYKKINSTYASGIDELIGEVKRLTDAQINYYAVIRPGALATIVDSLGGVEVDIAGDMKYSDPAQDLYINLKKGRQTLNGEQAEQYCRYRQYVMGDLDRTKAQQNFFSELFCQKMSAGYVTKVTSLFNDLKDKIYTNVSFDDIVSNIDVMQMLSSSSQVECFDIPGEYNDMTREKVSYYLIEDKDLDALKDICKTHFKIF